MKRFLPLLLLLLSGCATHARIETEHVSHPFAGPPFGDRTDEDALNQVNALLEWNRGNGWYLEAGVGYVVGDGGFYGPRLTATVRAGRRFDLQRWRAGR